MAFAAVIFMAVMGAIFDFGHIYYCETTLKYAVSQAARYATTGNQMPDEANEGKKLSREASIAHLVKEFAGFQDLSNSDIEIRSVNGAGVSAAGAGSPGDVVTVRARYRVSVVSPYLSPLFDEGRYSFEVVTSFKNEEFPGA